MLYQVIQRFLDIYQYITCMASRPTKSLVVHEPIYMSLSCTHMGFLSLHDKKNLADTLNTLCDCDLKLFNL
jgi:hypothetical protein